MFASFRHACCVKLARTNYDDETATVMEAMLAAGRSYETKVYAKKRWRQQQLGWTGGGEMPYRRHAGKWRLGRKIDLKSKLELALWSGGTS